MTDVAQSGTRRRRPYRAGLLLVVFDPFGVAGSVLLAGLLIVAAMGDGAASPTTTVGVVLWFGGVGAIFVRQSSVGIWVGADDVLIRSMFATRSIRRADIEDVRVDPGGALRIGKAEAPALHLVDGEVVVLRFLASGSPYVLGGNGPKRIVEQVGRALAEG